MHVVCPTSFWYLPARRLGPSVGYCRYVRRQKARGCAPASQSLHGVVTVSSESQLPAGQTNRIASSAKLCSCVNARQMLEILATAVGAQRGVCGFCTSSTFRCHIRPATAADLIAHCNRCRRNCHPDPGSGWNSAYHEHGRGCCFRLYLEG